MPGDSAANAALINRFYEAFARQDGEAMAACYTPDAHFHDPVFQDLHGAEVGAMWRMLCGRATDLEIAHSDVQADDDDAARPTGRPTTRSRPGAAVHNVIDASFAFENGLIADHRDDFDLYAWARQALGPVGLLLGWSPPVQGKIRAQAREGLDEFMAGAAAAHRERVNDRLSASDMSSLLAERGPIHVHVGATIVVQGKPPELGELVEHVDSRLGLIPRFRQRITSAGAMALNNPVWADDPRFDIERHVRRVALPEPRRDEASCASWSAG